MPVEGQGGVSCVRLSSLKVHLQPRQALLMFRVSTSKSKENCSAGAGMGSRRTGGRTSGFRRAFIVSRVPGATAAPSNADGLQKVHPCGRVPPRVQPSIPRCQGLDGEIVENLPGQLDWHVPCWKQEKEAQSPQRTPQICAATVFFRHQTASWGLVHQESREQEEQLPTP